MTGGFNTVFHGNSESECIDFIRAVRQHAIDKGKTKDNAWIADELFNAFSGKALKWYVRLPVDVRGDWERLQEALVDRWTADDEVDNIASVSSVAILPTPAAAPAASPLNSETSRTSSQKKWTEIVGRLRFRVNGIPEARYVSKDCPKVGTTSGTFDTTTDAARALKVRLITSTPNFYRLELVEHDSGLSVLAAFSHNSDDWNATDYWGLFVGVGAPGMSSLKDRQTTYTGNDNWMHRRSWTERWQIGNTGVLKLCGPGDITETTQFALGISFPNQNGLWFAGLNVSLYSGIVAATLEFEPLDN